MKNYLLLFSIVIYFASCKIDRVKTLNSEENMRAEINTMKQKIRANFLDSVVVIDDKIIQYFTDGRIITSI